MAELSAYHSALSKISSIAAEVKKNTIRILRIRDFLDLRPVAALIR
jgi:hypothetical protein